MCSYVSEGCIATLGQPARWFVENPAHWSLIAILSIFLLGIESLNFSWAHGYQARNNIFQLHIGGWAIELCPGQRDVKGEVLCSSGDIFTPLFCPFTQAAVW